MPIKEATIRFKIENIEGAASGIAQVGRAYQTAYDNMSRTAQRYSEAQKGLTEGKITQEDVEKEFNKKEQALQRWLQLQKKSIEEASMTMHQIRQREAEDTYQFQMAQTGDQPVKEALSRKFENTMSYLRAEEAAEAEHDAKVERKKIASAERVAAKVFALQIKAGELRAREVDKQQSDYERAERAMGLGQRAEETAKAEHDAKVEREKIASAERVAAKEFALQIKAGELRARELDKQQSDYERAERAMGLEQKYGKSGMSGALSGFGGKMILAHAAGIAAGDFLGDQHGGREISAAVGGFMFGGPVVGTVVTALELVGSAFRGARESAQEAQKASESYLQTLTSISTRWSGMVDSLVVSSSFGKAMESEFHRATEAAQKFEAQGRKMRAEGMPFSEGLWLMAKNFTASDESVKRSVRESGYVKGLKGTQQQASEERLAGLTARAYGQQEYQAQLHDLALIRKAQHDVYAAEAMRAGLLRDQAVLTAQIGVEEAKRASKSRAAAAAANAAVDSLARTLKRSEAAAAKLDPASDEAVSARQAANNVRAQWEEAVQARAELSKQAQNDDLDAAAKHLAQQAALKEREARALEDAQARADDAKIRAETQGYAQSEALRQAHNKRELALAEAQGQAILRLKQKEIDNENEAVKHRARESVDSALSRSDPNAAFRVYERKMGDYRAWGASKDELASLSKQELTANYLQSAEGSRLQLAVKRHEITQMDADIESMSARDVRAQWQNQEGAEVREAIRKEAQAREDLRQEEAAKSLDSALSRSDPNAAFRVYERKMAEYRAWGASKDELASLSKQELTANYLQSAEESRLQLAVKRHKITQMDADIESMSARDVRAQWQNREGAEVRAAIRKEARAREDLRQEEAAKSLDSALSRSDPNAAFRVYERKMAEYRAGGASKDELASLSKQELTANYLQSAEEIRLQLAVKRHQITQMDADIESMSARDVRAKWQNSEGAEVREAIRKEAQAREDLRQEEAADKDSHKRDFGSFSSHYEAGFVDYAALSGSVSGDPVGLARQTVLGVEVSNRTLTRIHAVLERLAEKGGLN